MISSSIGHQYFPSGIFPNLEATDKSRGQHGLTVLQAQAIFKLKPAPLIKHRDRALALAKIHGVSVKTVRDIWTGRTWYRETYHLDPSKPPMLDRLMKKMGRPKGVKDSKPRKKNANNEARSDNRRVVEHEGSMYAHVF